MAALHRSSGPALGVHFAKAARLEAASVHALAFLSAELTRHGAPGHLRRAAEAAAHDEVEHTQFTGWLAQRWGVQPVAPQLGALARDRSLEAMATENGVEGCVRETHGALVALWQARQALVPEVRQALATIAGDELRHAELDWAVTGWLEPQLSRAARVGEAKEQAIHSVSVSAELTLPSRCSVARTCPRPSALSTWSRGSAASFAPESLPAPALTRRNRASARRWGRWRTCSNR